MRYKYPFLDLLSKLGEDSMQLVLVGGWVPAVYFTYLWPDEPFLVTKDIDFGLDNQSVLNPFFENRVGAKNFKRRHLTMGKLRPYQLIFEESPIDFLTSPKNLERVKREVLGSDLLINLSDDYEDLLRDTLTVECEGIMVRVPQPARYLIHKIDLYLKNYPRRQRDIATAYFCLSNSNFREVCQSYLPTALHSQDTTSLENELTKFVSKAGVAILDIQEVYSQYGRYELPEDIQIRFQELLSWVESESK